METPIYDFVCRYGKNNTHRLHMPGHKGCGKLGIEWADITEIDGADFLYSASGIIKESEDNATTLFGSGTTLYSTEGSSQCIRAMLFLAAAARKADGNRPFILAARNSHSSFILAAALLDIDIVWLWPEDGTFSLCSADITPKLLEKALSKLSQPPVAVYVTSPNYLGEQLDMRALADVSHDSGVPLIVDNAHGAYLHFCPQPMHPLDCGADMCCDSAHKAMPVLTGGAYLHISRNAPELWAKNAKKAMALFGSTSPSYLILQSLDLANLYMYNDYRQKLNQCMQSIAELKQRLCNAGWTIYGTEPTKLTIYAPAYGYTGTELAQKLRTDNIECEYSDPDYIVMMFTPENNPADYTAVESALTQVQKKTPILRAPLHLTPPKVIIQPGTAIYKPSEKIPVSAAEGRILATPSVSCQPAIPICVCGEQISQGAMGIFKYYGIDTVEVIS